MTDPVKASFNKCVSWCHFVGDPPKSLPGGFGVVVKFKYGDESSEFMSVLTALSEHKRLGEE